MRGEDVQKESSFASLLPALGIQRQGRRRCGEKVADRPDEGSGLLMFSFVRHCSQMSGFLWIICGELFTDVREHPLQSVSRVGVIVGVRGNCQTAEPTDGADGRDGQKSGCGP